MVLPNMVAMPFPRMSVSSITPFTYRDGASYLELLNSLIESLKEVIQWSVDIKATIEALDDKIDRVETNSTLALSEALSEMRAENAQLKVELLQLISEVSVGGSCFNPTNGTSHESVSKVISDVYDNVRVHAFFAKNLDDQELTSTQFDGQGFSARHFDLSPAHATNDEL